MSMEAPLITGEINDASSTASVDTTPPGENGSGTTTRPDEKVFVIKISASNKIFAILSLIVGVILTLAMSIVIGRWGGPFEYICSYSVFLFIGLYITIKSILQLISGLTSSYGRIQLVMSDKTFDLPTSIISGPMVDILFALIMMITFLTMRPFWWTNGHIIGVILASLLLLRGCLGLSASFTNNRICLSDGSNGKKLTQRLSNWLAMTASDINENFMGFADNETATKSIMGSRCISVLMILVTIVLCILVIFTELILIRNWDRMWWRDEDSDRNHLNYWIWGPIGDVPSSMRYYACGSCAGLIVVSAIISGGIMRPSWYGNIVVAILAFASGVFFCLLSSYSFVSLMTLTETALYPVYRYMHLMPFPVIAPILLALGIFAAFSCFRTERNEHGLCLKFSKNFFLAMVAGATIASTIYSTWAVMEICQEKKKGDEPWYQWRDVFTVYLAGQGTAAILLATTAYLHMLAGNMKLPKVFLWLVSFLLLAASIFATFPLATHIGDNNKSEEVVFTDLPIGVQVLNLAVIGMNAVAGLTGVFVYARSVVSTLVIFIRLIAITVGGLVVLPILYFFTLFRAENPGEMEEKRQGENDPLNPPPHQTQVISASDN